MKLLDIFSLTPDRTLLVEDHAVDINMADLPDFNPRYSKVVGTVDNQDVWASRYYPGYHVFAFRDNDQIKAFIVIKDQQVHDAHPLTRMWSMETKETAGMVVALIVFLLRKINMKLIVTDDEPLTPKGWNSLIRGVARGSFRAVDAKTSQPLSAIDLQAERTGGRRTETAVVLEGDRSAFPIFGNGYRVLSEPVMFIGAKDLD
jgi:hypothetical protein